MFTGSSPGSDIQSANHQSAASHPPATLEVTHRDNQTVLTLSSPPQQQPDDSHSSTNNNNSTAVDEEDTPPTLPSHNSHHTDSPHSDDVFESVENRRSKILEALTIKGPPAVQSKPRPPYQDSAVPSDQKPAFPKPKPKPMVKKKSGGVVTKHRPPQQQQSLQGGQQG